MSDGNGALPEGWERETLGTISHIRTGKLDANAADEDGAYPFFTCAVEISHINEFSFDTEAVLLAGNGGFNVKWYQGKFNAYQRTYVIEPEGVSGRFLYHLIRYEIPEITEKNRGSTIKYLRLGDIADCNIELPPLAEQRRIVSKIESLQERSSRARRALSEVGPLLEQFRQSVLRAAFSGRLTADWRAAHRDVEPATELLSRIRTERRHRWEQSELAKYEAKGKKPPKNWQQRYKEPEDPNEASLSSLPDGWCWAKLDTLTTRVVDGTHHTPEYTDAGIAFLSVKDVRDGQTHFDDCRFVSPETHQELCERCDPEVGDVLITKSGTIGRTAVITTDRPFSLFVSVALIKPVLPQTLAPWIDIALRAWITTLNIAADVKGTAIKNLHLNVMREIAIPIPPIDEQAEIIKRIDGHIDAINEVRDTVAESESALTQLDQSILAKAFRGELVPQDPRDEPASELLARIRTTRDAEETAKPKRRKKKTAQKQPLSPSPSDTTVQQPLPLSVEEAGHEPQDTPQRPSASREQPPAPIDETDRNDVMASIRSVFIAHSDGLLREDAIRHLAHELGYKRTGSRIHEILGNDLIAAQKRRIIYREDDRYYLDCRSIEDYDRDDLVSLLQRAMGNAWWDETEAIKEATRLLGFRRTGRNITDTWKKTIALAIRRGELERNGAEIRRSR